MQISGQKFNSETIEKIRYIIKEDSSISRRALSGKICEDMNWRSPNGSLKDMSCRKALLKLDRKGLISLPKVSGNYSFNKQADSKGSKSVPSLIAINCSLKDLGTVELVPVSSSEPKLSTIWNGLIENYHYLGYKPLCGAQLRYLVSCEKYGWLGAVSFCGATWHLKSRDEYIGWSDGARIDNLSKVISNSRFLILPGINVKNLASHILGKCTQRISQDWMERYGYKPELIETYVDPARFTGTCYMAANWVKVGKTTGRRVAERTNGKNSQPKDVYLYPLTRNWQSILCREPDIPFGSLSPVTDNADWVEREFGNIQLYDSRIKKRLFRLTRDFFASPGSLIPEACHGSEAEIKAAYRLFDNSKISMETILQSHYETTLERIKSERVVLAVQDTSFLNYTSHVTTEGLGPINHAKDNNIGLVLHDTMAFTPEGTPLGLLDVQLWARDEKEAGKSKLRKKLPIEEKESMKWIKSYRSLLKYQSICPETTIVSVGDREADIYELFLEAASRSNSPELLIRSDRGRRRKIDQEYVWDKISLEDVQGTTDIFIPGNGSRKKRIAKMEIRFAKVTLNPPKTKRHLLPVDVWAVYSVETDYPPDIKAPLEWLLYSTVEITTFNDAVEKLSWYAQRWGIEIYHRTLKSGCRIEDRLLSHTDRLETCLAVDMVIAWRIYYLIKQGREIPDLPCSVFLKEEEWKILCARFNKSTEEMPTLQESVRMIAKLGGFIGRKADGEPGVITLWRGLKKFDAMMAGYKLAVSVMARAGPLY